MAEDDRFKFMNDALGTIMPEDAVVIRSTTLSGRTRLQAWGLGLLMGNYYQMDNTQPDVVPMLEAIRDGLPQLRLDPDVANVIVEGALTTFPDPPTSEGQPFTIQDVADQLPSGSKAQRNLLRAQSMAVHAAATERK